MRRLLVVTTFALMLIVSGSGCGLVGWQGEPSSERFLGITGTVAVQNLPDRDSLWTVETDTASYVPKNGLPSGFREVGLKVEATGVVGEPPDFYPDGYYFELRAIRPAEE